jgi:hypothetical protein
LNVCFSLLYFHVLLAATCWCLWWHDWICNCSFVGTTGRKYITQTRFLRVGCHASHALCFFAEIRILSLLVVFLATFHVTYFTIIMNVITIITLASCSGGPVFKSRPGDRLSWLSV